MSVCFATSGTIACQASLFVGLPRQEKTFAISFCRGIFPTQGSNRQILYHLSPLGGPPHIYTYTGVFFFRSPVDGHLRCFQALNRVAMITGAHAAFWFIVFVFCRYLPRSRIAGSGGSSVFSWLRSFHTLFRSGFPSLLAGQRFWFESSNMLNKWAESSVLITGK